MGIPFPVMQEYVGFMSDVPRHELPAGFCWDLSNFIPQLDGSLRRRYGFQSLGTQDFSEINAAATATGALVAYCPFSSVAHEVLALNGQGYAFSFQEPSFTGSYVAQLPTQYKSRTVWHRDQLVLQALSQEARFYTGRAGGFVAGVGTPKAQYGTLFGDYTVQANDGGSHKTRLWFSAAGDPRTYDLTNSWIDIPGVVKGLEGIRGAILVWTDHELWRITGTTPPQVNIVGDLDLSHLFDVGLVDERSIATYGGWVIWANAEGVWRTDGASAPTNLTVAGGINNYWRSIMAGYTLSSTDYIVAGGVYRGYYIVAVASLIDGVMATLVCDLANNAWFRFDYSAPSAGFSHAISGHEDLYFISSFDNRVMSTASAWETPSGVSFKGTKVLASLETPFFRGYQRFHRRWISTDATSVWQRLYLNYDAPQSAGFADALKLAYTTDPELGSPYTDVGQFGYTSAPARKRMPLNPNGGAIPARWIGFKLYQDASVWSDELRINDLELEYATREGSR